MQQYHTQYGRFPARAIISKNGKPLLSWRVALLPMFVGGPDDAKWVSKFHLDEPWDSENNKALIHEMPEVYRDPRGDVASDGRTRYVVPLGKNTIFEDAKLSKLRDISDSPSGTIMILEVSAEKAVIWTKPDDLEFDPREPLEALGTIPDNGFVAAFADGAVRTIPKSIDGETLRQLIIRNDGLPVDTSKLGPRH